MTPRLNRVGVALALAAAVAASVGACGSSRDIQRASTRASADRGPDASFSGCRGGRVTVVADRQGDVVSPPALGDDGRRVPPQPSMKPLGAVDKRGADLTRAAVQVRAGVLCLTFRTHDPPGPTTYILRLANSEPQGSPFTPSVLEIAPSTSGVLWHPQGAAEAEEAPPEYAYRRRGTTITVAVHFNEPFPQGIRTLGVSFRYFRWRLQSRSEPEVHHHLVRIAVDCVPNRTWMSFPSGRRVGNPPVASAIRSLRCPASS